MAQESGCIVDRRTCIHAIFFWSGNIGIGGIISIGAIWAIGTVEADTSLAFMNLPLDGIDHQAIDKEEERTWEMNR
jgi:hypothetical protein